MTKVLRAGFAIGAFVSVLCFATAIGCPLIGAFIGGAFAGGLWSATR